jgi:hypothetical protein
MADAPATVRIYGIQQTLKELNEFDNRYRRQVTKDIKNAGEIIISEARSMVASFPNSLNNGAPLSGMARGNLVKGRETRWKTDLVQKGFKVKVGVRASKERYVNYGRTSDGVVTHTEQVAYGAKPYQLMVIQQADAAGAIYDHAGRNTQSLFVAMLNKEVGQQPRAIDIAVERNREQVTAEVLKIVETVTNLMNRNIEAQNGRD